MQLIRSNSIIFPYGASITTYIHAQLKIQTLTFGKDYQLYLKELQQHTSNEERKSM